MDFHDAVKPVLDKVGVEPELVALIASAGARAGAGTDEREQLQIAVHAYSARLNLAASTQAVEAANRLNHTLRANLTEVMHAVKALSESIENSKKQLSAVADQCTTRAIESQEMLAEASEKHARQLVVATWVLAVATVMLFIATLGLAFRGV